MKDDVMQALLEKARTLTEALPWIKRAWGRVAVSQVRWIGHDGSRLTRHPWPRTSCS